MGGALEIAGHAFISYVREDARHVDRLQRALQAARIDVWRDTRDLQPGQDWKAEIRRVITENALVFIACFSKAAFTREETYQRAELILAIDQMRLRRPDVPWLIPVRFDDCIVPDYDLGGGRTLASIQRADLFGNRREANTIQLIAAIQQILERRSGSQRLLTQPHHGRDGSGLVPQRPRTLSAVAPPRSRSDDSAVNSQAAARTFSVPEAMLRDLGALSPERRRDQLRWIARRRPADEVAALVAGLHDANAHADAEELRRAAGRQPVSEVITLAAELRSKPGCRPDADMLIDDLATQEPAAAIEALRGQERSDEAGRVTRLAARRPVNEVLAILESLRNSSMCRDDYGQLLNSLAARSVAETAASVVALRTSLRHNDADKILKIAARRPADQVVDLATELQRSGRRSDGERLTQLAARRQP